MKTVKSLVTVIAAVIIMSVMVPVYGIAGQNTINQDVVEAHVLLGLSYAKMDDQVSATIEFEKALKLDPDFTAYRKQVADFYFDLGMIYIMNYELDGSRTFFNRALFLNNDHQAARNGLALAFSLLAEGSLETGDMVKAQYFYAKAGEIVPDFDPDHAYKLLSEDCSIMVKIDQMSTDFAATYCAVANEYYKDGKYREAKKYYETALELVPDCQRAKNGLEKVAQKLAQLNGNDLYVSVK